MLTMQYSLPLGLETPCRGGLPYHFTDGETGAQGHIVRARVRIPTSAFLTPEPGLFPNISLEERPNLTEL